MAGSEQPPNCFSQWNDWILGAVVFILALASEEGRRREPHKHERIDSPA